MKRTLVASILTFTILAAGWCIAVPDAQAVSSNLDCYKNDTGSALSYDEWSRFIKIAIAIPGLTDRLVCYEHGDRANVVDSFNYTTSLGDYLSKFYQYFVSIVGILAAVMILYGGIRWILAAGNQSRIQGAKDVILSAIIGVVIAFCSYLLLYLLNPRLVDYSTLETYLVPIEAVAQESEFCKDVSNPIQSSGLATFKFWVLEQTDERKSVGCAGYSYDAMLNMGKDLTGGTCSDKNECFSCGIPTVYPELGTWCGEKVAIVPYDATSGQEVSTCRGSRCARPFQTCVEVPVTEENPSGYGCVDSYLHGNISYEGNAYADFVWLGARCIDGEGVQTNLTLDVLTTFITEPFNWIGGSNLHYEVLPVIDLDEGAKHYAFPSSRFSAGLEYDEQRLLDAITECETDHGGFGGFYMQLEINDDTSFGTTEDDDFVIGKNCQPLTTRLPDDISADEWAGFILSKKLFDKESFFELNGGDWIINKSVQCNFNITRDRFPAR